MEAAVVYGFQIALRGVRPKILRRAELTAGSSLADLQRIIQIPNISTDSAFAIIIWARADRAACCSSGIQSQ
jgi:hypothetical protein